MPTSATLQEVAAPTSSPTVAGHCTCRVKRVPYMRMWEPLLSGYLLLSYMLYRDESGSSVPCHL